MHAYIIQYVHVNVSLCMYALYIHMHMDKAYTAVQLYVLHKAASL